MSDSIPRDGDLRNVARKAGEQLLFKRPTRVVGNGVPIYDILGPLIFVDYIVESDAFSLGWIRTSPDGFGTASGPLVSAQLGRHPSASTGGPSELLRRFFQTRWTLATAAARREFFQRPFVFLDELESRAGFSVNQPRIVCYHYPSVGVEIQVGDGCLAYIDVTDGRQFNASSEAGPDTKQQSRKPYSFLLAQSECGPPGAFTIPQDEFALTNVPLIGQERDNWCAAASCQMILQSLGHAVPQDRIATLMQIPSDPAQGGAPDLTIQANAYTDATGGLIKGRHDITPTGAECISEIWDNRRPVKNAIAGHAQVIVGWRNSEYGPQYDIRDPLPVRVGKASLQNPAVIYSRNFIFSEPQ